MLKYFVPDLIYSQYKEVGFDTMTGISPHISGTNNEEPTQERSRIICSPLASPVVLPENSDELWGEQLGPQRFNLSNVSQKTQHVAVKLLFIWKLL